MLSRRRLRRPFFLEMEFLAGGAAVGWAAVAYGTRTDMMQRPNLEGLAFLSDDAWAVIVGVLGGVQLASVLGNTKWGRWLVALPLSAIWSMIVYAIYRSTQHGADAPLALGLYLACAVCMLLKVARLPREFPPHG